MLKRADDQTDQQKVAVLKMMAWVIKHRDLIDAFIAAVGDDTALAKRIIAAIKAERKK